MMKTIKKYGVIPFLLLLIFAVSLSLSPVAAQSAAEKYETLVKTERVSETLQTEPSVVFEAVSQADLDQISEVTVKPAAVILTVNADMQVKLGDTYREFKTVFDSFLKGRAIPALRIEDDATADAFIKYMTDTYYIPDSMVVSSRIDLIEKIYQSDVCYVVNSVYDITGKALSENRYDFWQYIAEANTAGCNILLANGADSNIGVAAKYAASLSKVVWGHVGTESAAQAVGAIAAGCYGIVGQDIKVLQSAIRSFSEDGFARAQFIAAHRGITAYANENSATALAAAANEGATHVEVDLQITSDGELILCHDSDASVTSNAPKQSWVATKTLSELQNFRLNAYSDQYGDTFATINEAMDTLLDTDVIFIFELKLDNGSELSVKTLKAVEKMYTAISKKAGMEGRWMAITFYAPFAEQMRSICPEIPVGFLGFGKADNGGIWKHQPEEKSIDNMLPFISFLRKNNVLLDVELSKDTYPTLQAYLARGYVQNTWTFSDTSHFMNGANIATTNAAEDCAYLIKEVCVENSVTVTKSDIEAGKCKVQCRSYNGWMYEKECKILVIEGNADTDSQLKVLFYYSEIGEAPYGVYSELITVNVA